MPVTITLTDEQVAEVNGAGPVVSGNPDLDTITRPTKEEYDAGASLGHAVVPYDTVKVAKLARVGRAPDGTVARGFADLMDAFDECAKLEKSERTYFVDACKGTPPSWGAQQALVLVGVARSPGFNYERLGGLSSADANPANFAGMGLEQFAAPWFVFGGGPSGN